MVFSEAPAGRRANEIQNKGLRDLRSYPLEARAARCPFFEEVLVAFCRAYPVKKMVPSDRIQANCICTCERFDDCPVFREVIAKLDSARSGAHGGTRETNGPGSSGDQRELP